jgi:hypothetical protein
MHVELNLGPLLVDWIVLTSTQVGEDLPDLPAVQQSQGTDARPTPADSSGDEAI